MKKIFKSTGNMWHNFIEPGSKKASSKNSAGLVAKTKITQSGEVTSIILKSLTGAKTLSLTDMHSGAGHRLRVMWS